MPIDFPLHYVSSSEGNDPFFRAKIQRFTRRSCGKPKEPWNRQLPLLQPPQSDAWGWHWVPLQCHHPWLEKHFISRCKWMFSCDIWQCLKSQVVYSTCAKHTPKQSKTYCDPYPLNHNPPLAEMFAAGRLTLNCCKAVASLLLNCCHRLQLDFLLCDHFMLRVLYVYACRASVTRIWGSFQGSFWGRFPLFLDPGVTFWASCAHLLCTYNIQSETFALQGWKHKFCTSL